LSKEEVRKSLVTPPGIEPGLTKIPEIEKIPYTTVKMARSQWFLSEHTPFQLSSTIN
jgi:hypothetical protein